jgi:hypothetical protein
MLTAETSRGPSLVRPEDAFASSSSGASSPGRFGVALGVAVVVHVVALWALAHSIWFEFPLEVRSEPKIVAVAARLTPPPPDVETFGPVDAIATLPRFRPRAPALVPQRQKREGDPALAIWTYLCNRDLELSTATRVGCPSDFGLVDMSLFDPLNRTGDVGALFGSDTATMSLDEVAKKNGWVKPKPGWAGDGARAKDGGVGPGHDPFAFLPGYKPIK